MTIKSDSLVIISHFQVTFKDPEAAMRACQNPSPIIDGRRANCNLASLGATKTRPPNPQHGAGRFRPAPGLMAPPGYGSSSTYIQQPTGQYSIPYSAYGYTGYSQDSIYPLNYYSVYGGQQFSPYYTTGASSVTPGMFHSFFPYYAQYAQNSQAHGFGVQYPQMVQYPYLPQQYSSTGILSLPSSMPMAATTAGLAATITITAAAAPATAPATTTTTATTKTTTPPLPPATATATTTTTTGVVGTGPGPSQASGTPTEKTPSS
ncbi:hypothetical protein REPUB_Repub12eG0160300 [Reevesia pubescens]